LESGRRRRSRGRRNLAGLVRWALSEPWLGDGEGRVVLKVSLRAWLLYRFALGEDERGLIRDYVEELVLSLAARKLEQEVYGSSYNQGATQGGGEGRGSGGAAPYSTA